MPYDQPFTYKGHGTNRDDNHWCARDYGSEAPNQNAYHYSNRDGSYYYSNPDGSKYYNDGQGGAFYTPPSGDKPASGWNDSASSSARVDGSSSSGAVSDAKASAYGGGTLTTAGQGGTSDSSSSYTARGDNGGDVCTYVPSLSVHAVSGAQSSGNTTGGNRKQ